METMRGGWAYALLAVLAGCGQITAQRVDLPQRVNADTAQVIRYGVDLSLLQTTGHVVACYVTKKKPVAIACVAVPVTRPIDR